MCVCVCFFFIISLSVLLSVSLCLYEGTFEYRFVILIVFDNEIVSRNINFNLKVK